MPDPPRTPKWGWSPPGSNIGEINFAHSVLSSSRMIEYVAKERTSGCWSRSPTQSLEDFLSSLASHASAITEEDINCYLSTYNSVLFEDAELTKRQYRTWLRHFTAILQALDQVQEFKDPIEIPSSSQTPIAH